MANAPKDYKGAARKLKALGLLHIDLRKSLSPAAKARITKLEKLHKPILKNPDLYDRKTLGKESAKAARNIGATVIKKGNKSIAFIRKPTKNSTTRVKNGRIYSIDYSSGLARRYVVLDGDVFEALAKIKLRKGEFLTAKFGDHAMWERQFSSVEKFRRYVTNVWPTNDDAELKDMMLTGLSLVKVQNTDIDPDTGEIYGYESEEGEDE